MEYALSDTRLYFGDNPPLTIEAASDRRRQLIVEVAAIQHDLGSNKSTSRRVKISKSTEINRIDWIIKAKNGLHWRQAESMFLKHWMHNKREEGAVTSAELRKRRADSAGAAAGLGLDEADLDTTDVYSVLNAMYVIVARLIEDNVEFNNAERHVVFASHKLLKDQGALRVARKEISA